MGIKRGERNWSGGAVERRLALRERHVLFLGRGVGIFREEEGDKRVGRRALIEIESVERGAR